MAEHREAPETDLPETEQPASEAEELQREGETSPGEESAPEADAQAELEKRYLRLLADFDNHKRRTVKEKEDIYQYANGRLIEDLLPTLDAFDLALAALPEEKDEALASFAEGMSAISRKLFEALEKHGLTRIQAVGEIYDPHYHEAIMMVEDDSVPPQTIIDELRAGYKLKDRVLRPTVCRVATGK